MNDEVTVALTVHKAETHIHACIESLLSQTISNIEIVIVEDPPFDSTKQIIEGFNDRRIRYFRNKEYLGLSKSRNRCIDLAKGDYLFFTDSDCIVKKDWIEQGLEYFHQYKCIAVEGKIYYVSEEFIPTFSDGAYIHNNLKGGLYMTANMAYKKSYIDIIGYFDEKYTYLEDRDFALRAMKHGKIMFNPEMIVYHQKITLKPIKFIKTGRRIRNRVLLYKKFGEKNFIYWRIFLPLNLLTIFFPPLVFGSFFRNRYSTKEDLILFPFIYIKLIYERLNLWYMCIKERVFLI